MLQSTEKVKNNLTQTFLTWRRAVEVVQLRQQTNSYNVIRT